MYSYIPEYFPDSPGIYLMKDCYDRIIYVGKANSIRKRLLSYFREGKAASPKNAIMVKKIHKIDYLCTHTEKEALLLESSLIKKHKPKYNVVLRDDKSYILFKLDKNTDYPRLSLTRKVKKDGSLYFGPFTSAYSARQTLQVINRLFPLRKCRTTVFKNRTRPCLQYFIGRCLAPCVYQVSRDSYWDTVSQLELFLRGKPEKLIQTLEKEMYQDSANLEFEKAALKRDQIKAVQLTLEKQKVVSPLGIDIDVIGVTQIGQVTALGILFVRQGNLLDSKNFSWNNSSSSEVQQTKEKNESETIEEKDDLLPSFLLQFYVPGKFVPKQIIVPWQIKDKGIEEILSDRRGQLVRVRPPKNKQEKELVELAHINAREHTNRKGKQDSHEDRLKRRLNLSSLPQRIEAIDASHLSGQGMIVGQIVYEDGGLKKEDYRIYSFPELEGTRDDYAALANWTKRRLNSSQPWPDLVLIDGGKGQLSAVDKTLKKQLASLGQNIDEKWQLVSIAKAKEEGQDTVFRPERKNPVALKPGSKELLFLQYLRDNVHRFVLSRQKKIRSRYFYNQRLINLPGIGEKTAKILWEHFGSLKAIREASLEDLEQVDGIGKKRAQNIQQSLRKLAA